MPRPVNPYQPNHRELQAQQQADRAVEQGRGMPAAAQPEAVAGQFADAPHWPEPRWVAAPPPLRAQNYRDFAYNAAPIMPPRQEKMYYSKKDVASVRQSCVLAVARLFAGQNKTPMDLVVAARQLEEYIHEPKEIQRVD